MMTLLPNLTIRFLSVSKLQRCKGVEREKWLLRGWSDKSGPPSRVTRRATPARRPPNLSRPPWYSPLQPSTGWSDA
eukprot:4026236-Prymnesium_polylepis.1